jgi:Tol biopolymer transport system component
LLERCLERNVNNRLRDIGEARVEIAKIESGAPDSAIVRPAALPPHRERSREFFAWGVAGMAVLAALAMGVLRATPASVAAARVLRLWFVPALSRTLSEVDDTVISPNGQLLLFSARGQDGRRVLWLRALDSLDPQPLPDTEDPIEPFWSPDSRSIAFGAHGKLRRFDLGEARAQTLTDAGRLNSGSWSPSGVMVFSPDYGSGLMRVAATGGERAPATRLGVTRGDVGGHRYPVFLPDGHHFLYWAQRAVRVGDLDSANTKELLADFGPAVYAPPGWLLYIRNGIVVAHRFDATRLELSGDPMPIATVPNSINNPVRQRLSASTNGTLVVPNGNPFDYQLGWFDRSGKSLGAAGPMRTVIIEELPQISPDGAHVLVQRRDMQTASQNLWMGDLTRGTYDRFTTDRGFEQMAMWSHDGRRVFCSTSRNGVNGIYAIPVAGGPDELLLQGTVFPGDVSPDGRWLFYMRRGETTRLDIWVLPLTGSDRAPHVLINSEFDEHQPQISPDGQWIAYTSDVAGTREVYVRRFTDGTVAEAMRVSAAGGQQPRWSRDGRELFYVNAAKGFLQAQLTAVPVTRSGGSVAFGAPAPLFKVSMFPSNSLNRDYDLSPDGQRFLIGTASEGDRVAPATLVLNWTAALKK